MNTTQYTLTSHYLLGNDVSPMCYYEIPYGLAYKTTPTNVCGY